MTDRIRKLTVHLDHDIRDDDVDVVVQAIKMVKCVSRVELGDPVSADAHDARDEFRRTTAGLAISILHAASGMAGKEDTEFLERCRIAQGEMRRKRGY